MPSTRKQRTPVKCYLCNETVGHRRETKTTKPKKTKRTTKSKRTPDKEYTDVVDHRSIPGNSSVTDKTIITPLEEFTHVLSDYSDYSHTNESTHFLDVYTLALVKLEPHRNLYETLMEGGFARDSDMNFHYGSGDRGDLLSRYHGLGHARVVGVDPHHLDNGVDKCYFMGIIGGNNASEYESNRQAFLRIGEPGTTYYNASEILQNVDASRDSDISQYDSAPKTNTTGYFDVTPVY